MQTEIEEASLLAPDSDEIQSGVITALFRMAKSWRRQYKDDRPTLGEYSREVVKQLGVWVNDGAGLTFEESGIYIDLLAGDDFAGRGRVFRDEESPF